MRGWITLKRIRIFGAPLHIHWSAWVAAAILFGVLIRKPIHALVAVTSYFALILLHEAGHAFIARQLGYPALNIYVTVVHGICEHAHPDTLKEQAIIAWGGVLAQLAVAVPLIVLSQTTPLGSFSMSAIVISILGYLSLLVALINLAPARGLDGATAWQLFPIVFRQIRYRSSPKKTAKSSIRRIK